MGSTVHAFCKDVAVIEKAQSDHFLLIIDLNTHKPPVQKKKILSRKLKDINFERLKQDLILALRSPENIDINDLENILKELLDKHAPLQSRTISHRHFSPWYNLEVKEAKQSCRRAERKWRKHGLEIFKQIFKSASSTVNNIIENYLVPVH